jgi:charged multivesicular body protein 7
MAKAAGEQSHSPADALRAYLAIIPEYSTARVQFYYSSLPSRKHSNPTGYASALAWWRKTLVDLTARGLLGDEHLREHLRWDKIGRPSSLGVITVSETLKTLATPEWTYRPL